MAQDFKALELREKEVLKENEKHLEGFADWLRAKGLSQKTIRSHMSNVDFYINNYLCYYDVSDVKQGAHQIHGFFGTWFIRKAAWSSCAIIKSSAAGIKKFYAYLLENNVVDHEDYDDLCATIKEFMPDYLNGIIMFSLA